MKSDKQVVPFYRKSFSSHQVYKTQGSIRTIAVLILWTWNLDINKRYSLMLVIYPPKQLWKRQTFLEKQDTPRCSNRKQEQITNDVLNFEFWTLRFSRLDFIIRDSVFLPSSFSANSQNIHNYDCIRLFTHILFKFQLHCLTLGIKPVS